MEANTDCDWLFAASEVCELAGISAGTLQNWLARDVLHIAPRRFRGPHRSFDPLDVIVVAAAAALSSVRVPPRVMEVLRSTVRKKALARMSVWSTWYQAVDPAPRTAPRLILILHSDPQNPSA